MPTDIASGESRPIKASIQGALGMMEPILR